MCKNDKDKIVMTLKKLIAIEKIYSKSLSYVKQTTRYYELSNRLLYLENTK